MNDNLRQLPALVALADVCERLGWVVNDLKGHATAGVQYGLMEQRLDEIGDLLADCKSLFNSAALVNRAYFEEDLVDQVDPTSSPPPGPAAEPSLYPYTRRSPARQKKTKKGGE